MAGAVAHDPIGYPMSAGQQPRIEYIEARRVLLDALTALEPHIEAVILVGAQAVYLRTVDRLPALPAYTIDADLLIHPNYLAGEPPLGDAMEAAGFEHAGHPGMWQQRIRRPGREGHVTVPVDLIVPSEIASKAGRRGARLPGAHGKTAARKTRGVEGALLDHDDLEVTALEPDDDRRLVIKVAGVAALLVAKAHKLGERLDEPRRLQSKDAGDVYRLVDATPVAAMATAIRRLLVDSLTMSTTEQALAYLARLFQSASSPGTKLAARALSGVIDPQTVTSIVARYTRELLDQTRPGAGSWAVSPREGSYGHD